MRESEFGKVFDIVNYVSSFFDVYNTIFAIKLHFIFIQYYIPREIRLKFLWFFSQENGRVTAKALAYVQNIKKIFQY